MSDTTTCDVCGRRAAWYEQTLYGRKAIVRLCRAHAKSRRALGYTLRPANR